MHGEESSTPFRAHARPARWPGLRRDWLLILAASLACAATQAAPQANSAGASSQAGPSGFAGAGACDSCHESESKDFAASPHSKMASMPGASGLTCESCHGPGQAHVAGGGIAGNIFNPAKASAREGNALCLKCHSGQRGPFVYEHPAMKTEGCMACHAAHGSQNPQMLKMADVNALCNQCHSAVSAAGAHGAGVASSPSKPCIDCHVGVHGSNLNAAFLR